MRTTILIIIKLLLFNTNITHYIIIITQVLCLYWFVLASESCESMNFTFVKAFVISLRSFWVRNKIANDHAVYANNSKRMTWRKNTWPFRHVFFMISMVFWKKKPDQSRGNPENPIQHKNRLRPLQNLNSNRVWEHVK